MVVLASFDLIVFLLSWRSYQVNVVVVMDQKVPFFDRTETCN